MWRDPLKIKNKGYIGSAVSNAALDHCRKHTTNLIDLAAPFPGVVFQAGGGVLIEVRVPLRNETHSHPVG
jgi:hypothetical protein